MKITNTKIYDLEEAIIASGFPMQSKFDEYEFDLACNDLYLPNTTLDHKHFDRAIKLASCESNSGHCSFLKLIVVNANFTACIKWWEQIQRYNFFALGSSFSTIHKAKNMNMLEVIKGADPRIISLMIEIQKDYNDGKIDFNQFIKSIPVGLELTCRCTTNYLQLKNVFNQRCSIKHRLDDWADFGKWVEELPYAKEFIILKG